MKGYLLWLDDERPVPKRIYENFNEEKGFSILKASNYDAAIGWLDATKTFQPNAQLIICFDHDLGMGKTGYDVAKYIVENHIKLDAYDIHSMNPVGVLNISELLNHYGYKRVYIV